MSELKVHDLVDIQDYRGEVYLKTEADRYIGELKGTIERNKIANGSVRRILWNLMDCGIIKEWYYNGEYNVLLSADDPHIQIAELKTKIDKVSLKFCKQLRHQKYKRCLAMAMWCETQFAYYLASCDRYDSKYVNKKAGHFYKWKYKWLELAEKFKEAK